MEGYVDIFATKGIEYLLVIGFLLCLVLYWRFLHRTPAEAPVVAGPVTPSPAPWFRLARGLYYHQGHTWARPEGDDVVRVGVDDFAQKLLGRASGVVLPAPGTRVEQGTRGWQLQVGTTPVGLLCPVDGKVIEVNEEAVRSPGIVNEDPYGRGWLLRVRAPGLGRNLKSLLSGRLAVAWMEDTVDALRRRMAGDLGVVMQDGGLPVTGIAASLSPEGWEELARDFLMSD